MPEAAYHLPVRPFGPIDAMNRRAAAVGSPGYAMLAAGADYNGHPVGVHWNDYRGYYVAEYHWGERVVLARSVRLADCLRAALAEYNRGALGSSVSVGVRDGDDAGLAACEAAGLTPGALPSGVSWWTWRHDCAVRSVRDYAHPGASVMLFDWQLMQEAADQPAYEAAIRAKYGRLYSGERVAVA